MSKALKCDRCKTCFDPYTAGEFARIGDIYYQTGEQFKDNKYGSHITYPDLCPECTKLFKLFMSGFDISAPSSLKDGDTDGDEETLELFSGLAKITFPITKDGSV